MTLLVTSPNISHTHRGLCTTHTHANNGTKLQTEQFNTHSTKTKTTTADHTSTHTTDNTRTHTPSIVQDGHPGVANRCFNAVLLLYGGGRETAATFGSLAADVVEAEKQVMPIVKLHWQG